jgi:hypothetical protein
LQKKKILVWCDDPPEDRVISIFAGCLANHDRASREMGNPTGNNNRGDRSSIFIVNKARISVQLQLQVNSLRKGVVSLETWI